MQLVVDRYPTCDDVVQIDTWRAVSGKNSGRTDWLFRDSQTGKILVRASRLSKYPDEVRAELEQYYLDTPPIIIDGDTKNDMELDKCDEYVRKGLLATWKDLDMNQHVNNVKYLGWILELPELEGTVVSKGSPLLEGHKRPQRTTNSLGTDKTIHEKTHLQKVVEKVDKDVVAAREEKERKKLRKQPLARKR
ncbi:palmitoyl-acyl carrier protein thioesterase, chloroplastic [Artemisia annua]|uniref:Palmitoyl-acyl carrier protein thioesterase, chloroplastic n=1 Tax=Artemisia annua TaxID=35608 RepID=A0A2U1N6N1_ARTAN|nr:palmitoyl-acyl carrier protein thioesterase, chloroplastic [Artemisia annua]